MPIYSKELLRMAKKSNKSSRVSKDERIFNIINVAFMIFFIAVIALPMLNILAITFNDANDAAQGGIYFWPRILSFESFRRVLEIPALFNAFLITVARTVIGAGVHVLFTAFVAYGFSKNDLVGRKWYIRLGVFTMFFSGGMIPTFLLFRTLGLLNNFLVFIIPAMFGFVNMVIVMNFYKGIPNELEESAEMDGAGPFLIFIKIMLPLSIPVLATIGLFAGVGQWNDFMTANIFLTNRPDLHPMAMLLYRMIAQQFSPPVDSTIVRPTTSESIRLAMMVISTAPILVVYPFLQKYFVKGMMIGAVK